MKFNPNELVGKRDVKFKCNCCGEILCPDNWPKNLIYNGSLFDKDDGVEEFYETFWSDTTMTFLIESAIGRIKSLFSRSVHDWKNENIEHSDIHVIFYDDDPKEHNQPRYMQRSKVVLYLRKV